MHKFIQVAIVADNEEEIQKIAKSVRLPLGDYIPVTKEEMMRGQDPGRLVVLRGALTNTELYNMTNFFGQIGAVVLDIQLKDIVGWQQ